METDGKAESGIEMRYDVHTRHSLPSYTAAGKMHNVVIPVRTSSWNHATSQSYNVWTPGKYNFDEIPTLHQPRRQTTFQTKRQSIRRPLEYGPTAKRALFDQLPTEVYHLILEHIVNSRVDGVDVDVPCLLRDLLSCSLVSKRWYHAAQEHIYGHLWLLSNGLPKRRKRFSLSRAKGRLDLLVRTLTEKRHLAQMIYAAHITPALQAELVAPKSLISKSSNPLELVKAVIDCCPNLEQITGFLPGLDPHFATYFQALLGRPQLRTLAWWTRPEVWYVIDLDRLGQYERCWHSLETLILSHGNATNPFGSSPGTVMSLVRSLPSLQRLMLSGFSKQDVNDDSLMDLPPLRALRLDKLSGVTDDGLAAFAKSEKAATLQSLTLHALELKQMSTIRAILDNCTQLLRFRVVQMRAFVRTEAASYTQALAVFQSPVLRYLHWETLDAGDALELIAGSIRLGGLQSLHSIKVPNDHEGTVQEICRPIHETSLTADDIKFLETERLHQSSHSIRLAQLRAQQRIQDRRQQPSFNFRVADEHDNVQTEDIIGSFLGQLHSTIEYSLDPDVPGATEALCQFSDLVKPPKLPTGVQMSTTSLHSIPSRVLDFDLLF